MNRWQINDAIAQQVNNLIWENGGLKRYRANKQAFYDKLKSLGAGMVSCYDDRILIDDIEVMLDG